MQSGLVTIKLSICLFVPLSVRLSVKRVICDKTKEIYGHIPILHERSFILISSQEERLMEGANPFL